MYCKAQAAGAAGARATAPTRGLTPPQRASCTPFTQAAAASAPGRAHTMFGKPGTSVLGFEKLSMRSSMVYHRVYHYSWPIALNHLLFLNTYVLGVLLVVDSCGGPLALYVVVSLYATYSLAMSLGAALPYMVCIALLCVAAQRAGEALRSSGGLDHSWEVPCVGVGLVLLSFIAQLVGHALHEEFSAPPDLFHGFVAAPVLESISLQMRLGLMPRLSHVVDMEVDRVRLEARRAAQEHHR